MGQINFKRGFQRIFSVICIGIILIGGFISWNNALIDAASRAGRLTQEESPFDWLSAVEVQPTQTTTLTPEQIKQMDEIAGISQPAQNVNLPAGFELDAQQPVAKKSLWYEYITTFTGSFLSNFAITLIVAGCVYGAYLLLVWIFSGFKKEK